MIRNQQAADMVVRQHRNGSWHVYDEAQGEAVSVHYSEADADAARWDGLTAEQREDEELFFSETY
jgi:hypothetical protein